MLAAHRIIHQELTSAQVMTTGTSKPPTSSSIKEDHPVNDVNDPTVATEVDHHKTD